MSSIGEGAHFEDLLGFELLSASETSATAQARVSPRILQPGRVVHGGVYAALALAVAEHGTARRAEAARTRALANTTTLLRPIAEGRILLAAERLHAGRSTTVWSVRAIDSAGQLCATSVITLGHEGS